MTQPTQQGRTPMDADYGMGEHEIDAGELGLLDEGELTLRLVATFESPDYKPPRLPKTATELLSLSQQAEVDFEQLERLLEQDALLAGEVLSIARSAYYSRRRPVESLREALVRIGLSKLRDIVMQAAMNMRVFRCKAYAPVMERLQLHSSATALVARIVSRYTPIAEEQAFLCGLLHDVGIAGALLVLGDVERGQEPPDLSLLWPAIDSVHPKAGARMTELWQLPPEIVMVIGAHHEVAIQGFDHPIAATVCLADAVARELHHGLVPTDADAPPIRNRDLAALVTQCNTDRSNDATLQRAREALQLSDAQLDLIREDAKIALEADG